MVQTVPQIVRQSGKNCSLLAVDETSSVPEPYRMKFVVLSIFWNGGRAAVVDVIGLPSSSTPLTFLMFRTLQSRMRSVSATLRGFQTTAAAAAALRPTRAATGSSFLSSGPSPFFFDSVRGATTVAPATAGSLLLRPTQQQQQVRYRSNRSRRGLYDGKDVRSGNNVSFSMKATKRKFKPNVFVKRVYSQLLDAMIPFHLTASTLRSIDKAGGLDNYLLHPKRVITEGEGYVIKRKLLQRIKNQERYNRKQHEKESQQQSPQLSALAGADNISVAAPTAATEGVAAISS